MDTQNDRKTTAIQNRIPLPADDLPVQPVGETQVVGKTEPVEQVKEMDYFPAVVEWEGREVRRTESPELIPYVEMSNNEIAETVRYVATKGGQVVAIGVYFAALGVVTIVKYVAIGVVVFVWEGVKMLFKMSRKGPSLVAGDDTQGPRQTTNANINVMTNVNAGGNVTINQNIRIG